MSKFTQTMFSGLKQTKSFVRVIEEHVALINIVVLALILVVGMLYIIQVNHSVTKGYEIRDLETMIGDLRLETELLESQVAENRSMAAVDERVQMLGMVPATGTDYVDAGVPAVALNR